MRIMKRYGAVAIALCMTVAVADAFGAAEITVGQFVQQLARTKSLNATDAVIAADSLSATGFDLPSDLNFAATLTEGDVAKISRAVGLNVRTARPDTVFTDEQSDRFFSAFSRQLGDSAAAGSRTRSTVIRDKAYGNPPGCGLPPCGNGRGEGEFPRGKGKGKPHQTPTDPD